MASAPAAELAPAQATDEAPKPAVDTVKDPALDRATHDVVGVQASAQKRGPLATLTLLAQKIPLTATLTAEGRLANAKRKLEGSETRIASYTRDLNDPAFSDALRDDRQKDLTKEQDRSARLTGVVESRTAQVVAKNESRQARQQQSANRSADTQLDARITEPLGNTRAPAPAEQTTNTNALAGSSEPISTASEPVTVVTDIPTTTRTDALRSTGPIANPDALNQATITEPIDQLGPITGALDGSVDTTTDPSTAEQGPIPTNIFKVNTLTSPDSGALASDTPEPAHTGQPATIDTGTPAGTQDTENLAGNNAGSTSQAEPISATTSHVEPLAVPVPLGEQAPAVQQPASADTSTPAVTARDTSPIWQSELTDREPTSQAGQNAQNELHDAQLEVQRLQQTNPGEPMASEEQIVMAQERARVAQQKLDQALDAEQAQPNPQAPEPPSRQDTPANPNAIWQSEVSSANGQLRTREAQNALQVLQDRQLAVQRLEHPPQDAPRPTELEIATAQQQLREAQQEFDTAIQVEARNAAQQPQRPESNGQTPQQTDQNTTSSNRKNPLAAIGRAAIGIRTRAQQGLEQRRTNNLAQQYRDAAQRLERLTDLSAGAERHSEGEIAEARSERNRLARLVTPDMFPDAERSTVAATLEQILQEERHNQELAARNAAASKPAQTPETQPQVPHADGAGTDSSETAAQASTETPVEPNSNTTAGSVEVQSGTQPRTTQDGSESTNNTEQYIGFGIHNDTETDTPETQPQTAPENATTARDDENPQNQIATNQEAKGTELTPEQQQIWKNYLDRQPNPMDNNAHQAWFAEGNRLREQFGLPPLEQVQQDTSNSATDTEPLDESTYIGFGVHNEPATETPETIQETGDQVGPDKTPDKTTNPEEATQVPEVKTDEADSKTGGQSAEGEKAEGEQDGKGTSQEAEDAESDLKKENAALRKEVSELKQLVKQMLDLQTAKLSEKDRKSIWKKIFELCGVLGIAVSEDLFKLAEEELPK